MKKIIAFLLALAIVSMLVACSISSGDLIGIWSGSWEFDGHTINNSVQFKRDGTYYEVTYRDHTLASTEEGTYTIDGNKVMCEDNVFHGITTYKYFHGKLTNNGHSLTKE